MGRYEDDKVHRESSELIKMSYVSLHRILQIIQSYVDSGGEISRYEINTLKYLVSQCHAEDQAFLKDKFTIIKE